MFGQNEIAILFYPPCANQEFNGKKTIICTNANETFICNKISDIPQNKDIFGYIGYELKNSCDTFDTATKKSILNFPTSYFATYKQVKEIENFTFDNNIFLTKTPRAKFIERQFSKFEFIQKVNQIKQLIANGEVYQVNLTCKFFGEFDRKLNHGEDLSLFAKLTKKSTSSYSCFFRLSQQKSILCLSPERFLKITEDGRITTNPIKGTIPSNVDSQSFLQDKKNLAENLMITDLMRNDFAKICENGTVKVPKLFEITTHNNLHHLSSQVEGYLKEDASIHDILKACFPAGSMTGAPKIMACNIASKLEEMERGVYSGCIGYIKQNKKTNLAVIIRTLLIDGDKFEFSVGGGITFDSNPEEEYIEILTKAKHILSFL